jgi:hypothetical protein
MSADAHDNVLEALSYDSINIFKENVDLHSLRQATKEEEEEEEEEAEEEKEFDMDEYDKKLVGLFGNDATNATFAGRVAVEHENQENHSPSYSTPTRRKKKTHKKKLLPSSPTRRESMTWHLDEDTHLGRGAFGDVVAGWLILPSERSSSSSSSNQRGDNIKERVAIKILKTGCGGDLRGEFLDIFFFC